MPKYLVTSGSHFTPFTYDELAKPLMQMQEAHNAAQDAYDTLSLETNALQNYITDNPGDARAKSMYDSYMNKLSALQDNLWRNGYNSQTRRDLSLARSAYASDITPVATAIRNRQERSREYWDAKHKNPDLIMGSDPGLNGLDDYIGNEEFGRNWYAYNGNTFSQEVGADAKARASEMLRMPEVVKDSRLVGYLTRIERDGFTNKEVDDAGKAVHAAMNGDSSYMSQLDPASSILAGVLMSHLDATGARGQVSDAEFNRLFNYGMTGLAQAVGKTSIRELNDKQWDYAKQVALANMRQAGSSGGRQSGGKKETPDPRPYTLNDISSFMQANGGKDAVAKINKKFFQPFEEPITVIDTNGQPDVITNYSDASRILSGFGKDDLIREYGIDPDKPIRQGKPQEVVSEHGRMRISQAAPSGYGKAPNGYKVSVQKEDGTYEYDPGLSADLTKKYNEYQDRVKAWKKNNKGVDLQGLAIRQDERKKLYDDENIPYDIPFDDIPYIYATKAKLGRVTPATIASSTKDMKDVRENYTNELISAFRRAPKDNKGRVAKTDESAFYPVDGFEIAEEGVRDIKKVFGQKKDGSLNDAEVNEIIVYPEDLAKNRVRVIINGQQYAVNPAMLGNDMDVQIQKLRGPVNALMLPINDPVAALQMSDEEVAEWLYEAQYYLQGYMDVVSQDENGNMLLVTPADIVRNPSLQSALRSAVTGIMNNVIAYARDNMNQNTMQTRTNTSANPAGYNDYLNE